MPPTPTSDAPKSFDELVNLIADDNKVKVAGTLVNPPPPPLVNVFRTRSSLLINSGLDIDGVLRGKFMSISKFKSAAKSSFGFCSVIFGWDGFTDTVYSRELTVSNSANGYHDISAVVDWGSYRRLPWEKNAPFFLVSFRNPETDGPLHACPRSLLGEVMKKVQGQGEGWQGMAGAEFEVSLRDLGSRGKEECGWVNS
jgi:glutamine synthetase